MTLRIALALACALALSATVARADDFCSQLGKAAAMAGGGFGPAEGDPVSTDADNHYWRSTLQLSEGDHCAIEAHKVLSCSWEPSTSADLERMIGAVAACFPKAHRIAVPAPDGPAGASFRLEHASIDLGLTADVLSLNVQP
jgi:hypothetical protein